MSKWSQRRTRIFSRAGLIGLIGALGVFQIPLSGQVAGPEVIIRGDEIPEFVSEWRTAFDGTAGYIAWEDLRSDTSFPNDIYAQKINADGTLAWTAGGHPVATTEADQENPRLVPDGKGGIIVIWTDERPSGRTGIYGQWIQADGSVKWTQDGVEVGSPANDQYQPNVHLINENEFYVTHGEERGPFLQEEFYLVVHRVNGAGEQVWDPNGLTALEGIRLMSSVPDGSGGLVVFGRIRAADVFGNPVGEGEEGYRVQRVLTNQTLAWANPVEILADIPKYSNSNPFFGYAPDEAGGVVIGFYTEGNLRAVRVAGDGSTPWGPTGVLLSESPNINDKVSLQSDHSGGAYVSWIEDGLPDRMRVQHVLSDGTIGWQAGGVELPGTSSAFFGEPYITDDGTGGLLLTYETGGGAWAQRMNANGTTLWDELGGNGLYLDDRFEPTIGPGPNGPLILYDSIPGLAGRIITGVSDGLTVDAWAETSIGWVYGMTPEWGNSAYMGFVYVANLPYLYQVNLGWMYLFSSNRPEHILFDIDLGWILTNEGWGGFYYIYNTDSYALFSEPQP